MGEIPNLDGPLVVTITPLHVPTHNGAQHKVYTKKRQVYYLTPLNYKVRSQTQCLSLVLCLHLQSLTDCKVPLSQGPSYVWRWLLIVVISD